MRDQFKFADELDVADLLTQVTLLPFRDEVAAARPLVGHSW